MPKLINLQIDALSQIGVQVFKKEMYLDIRGEMKVTYEGENFPLDQEISIKTSKSKAGVGRGLHYQLVDKAPQTKIISVQQGVILDFLYDPTSNSNEVYYIELSDKDMVSIVIPPKFSHGFIAIDDAVLDYFCFGKYNESCEMVFNMLPSAAKLIGLKDVILSEKDSFHPLIDLTL